MTITIAGGGIGGLALALALRQVGQSTEVLESANRPIPGTGGAFLNLAPNGVNALRTLGVADQVIDRGIPATGIDFHNASGRRIGQLDATGEAAAYGAANLMIRRADLHHELSAAVEAAGVEVRYGHRITKVTENPTDIEVELASGARRSIRYLAGADGVDSATRTHVAGPQFHPTYLGLVDLAGFAPFAPVDSPSGPQRMFFGRRAFFSYFVTPTGETWWFSNIPHPGRPDRAELAARSPADWLADLLAVHRDDPPVVGEILRHTAPVLGPWPLTDLAFLPRWHTDRVCLMGDAAHATSPSAGQGAALAIEDAVELAREIAYHGPGPAAFSAFEQRRRTRVQALIHVARRNGSYKAPGPIGQLMRDRLLPLFLRRAAKETAAAYAHQTAPLPTANYPSESDDA